MSQTTAPPVGPPPVGPPPAPQASGGADRADAALFAAALRAEWIKLRSVRSTYWTLFAAGLAVIGLGALVCVVYLAHYNRLSPSRLAHFDPISFSLSGVMLAQLAVGVLGVLVVTNEYSSGMIRSTFAAVPQRGLVLAAKATVFAGLLAVFGIISSVIAFFIGQAILDQKSLGTTIGAPGAVRTVIGAGLYLAVLGLLAMGLGVIIRHSAGAIAAVFGLILVLPGIMTALPTSWQNAADRWLPSDAGQAVWQTFHRTHQLAPWVGFGVFCAYAAAALLIGGYLLNRRDA